MTRTQVPVKILGSVNGVARKQDLRYRRFSQRDVACREQDIRAAALDQFRTFRLSVPETANRQPLRLPEVNISESLKLIPQTRTQSYGHPYVELRITMWEDIAHVRQ